MLRNERKFKRRCLVCRNYFLQKEMFRIRKQDATFLGQWASPVVTVLSPHSLCQGRSAYLCSSQACWVKIPLQKGRLLSQALRTQLSSQALESLMETLQNPPPPKKHTI